MKLFSRNRTLIAEVAYMAVLDGQTLNLDLCIPDASSEPVIRLVHRRTVLTAPAWRRDDAHVSAAILLGTANRGLPVERAERWMVTCRDGATTYRLAGQSAVEAPRGESDGHRYQPEFVDGELALRVDQPAALAELDGLDLGWTGATVRVRIVGFDPAAVVGVDFTSRETKQRHTVALEDGVCQIPVTLMAGSPHTDEWFWEVAVRTVSGRQRLGRFLHDVPNPKTAFRLKTGIVHIGPGRSLRVRPYFTPAGSLVLACATIGRS